MEDAFWLNAPRNLINALPQHTWPKPRSHSLEREFYDAHDMDKAVRTPGYLHAVSLTVSASGLTGDQLRAAQNVLALVGARRDRYLMAVRAFQRIHVDSLLATISARIVASQDIFALMDTLQLQAFQSVLASAINELNKPAADPTAHWLGLSAGSLNLARAVVGGFTIGGSGTANGLGNAFGGAAAVLSIAQAGYGLHKELNPGRGPPPLAPTAFNELPVSYAASALQEMGDPATATLQQLAGVDVSFVMWDRAYVSRQLLLLQTLIQQHGDLLQDIVLSTFGGWNIIHVSRAPRPIPPRQRAIFSPGASFSPATPFARTGGCDRESMYGGRKKRCTQETYAIQMCARKGMSGVSGVRETHTTGHGNCNALRWRN
jgi:hypothetical protein